MHSRGYVLNQILFYLFLISKRKGIANSALPYKRTPPAWLKISSQEVCDQVCKLAKKGLTPSQIGVILRDSHGIAQVRNVTGNKIVRVLKANGKLTHCTGAFR
jgi:small subunit ribosomal protein S13e